MNHEFLLSPQSFMNNTVAPDYAARNKQHAKAFQSKQADTNTQNRESFDSFMRDLQSRKERSDQASKTGNKTTDAPVQNKQAQSQSDKAQFLTKVTAAPMQSGTDLLMPDTSAQDDALSSITLKMEQILKALEKAKLELADKSVTDTKSDAPIQGIETEIPEGADDASGVEILALFLNIEPEKAAELKNSDSAQDIKDLLAQVMDQLRRMMEDEKSLLITTNKTPADLVELQKIVENILKEEINAQDIVMLEKLAAKWSSLSMSLTQSQKANSGTPVTTAEIVTAAQNQNNLASGDKPQSTDPTIEKSEAKSRYDERYKIDSNTAEKHSPDTQPKQSGAENINAAAKPLDTNTQTRPTSDSMLNAVETALIAPPTMTAQGALVFTDQNGAVIASIPSPSQAALTNVTTQAQHASHPHPATQTIMSTISKAIKGGETTELKIQLDPPELGRVEVKMSIDKDNITKVVLTSERPETHMMLQKDAHMLERMLQNSGLYEDGSLSFELADSSDQGQHAKGGKDDTSGKHNAGQDAEDILETTMDWNIDPDTGATHYTIWA